MARFYNISAFAVVGVSSFLAGKLFSNPQSDDSGYFNTVFAKSVTIADVPISAPVGESIKDAAQNKSARISQIMRFGFPSLDNVRSLDDFVLSYDKRNRVPNWVLEHLTAESVKFNSDVDRNKCDFHEDSSIHPFFRSQNSDYKGSGFDRGHLAAAGNHKQRQDMCEQTFLLSNMAPQVGRGFNRDSWNRLEKYTRKLTKKYANVYICTGPLYLPKVEDDGLMYVKYRVIGNSHVAVPTHFFKVVLCEASDKTLDVEAYVMPNQPIGDDVPLDNFRVPPESIERAAGLLFFDRLPQASLKLINGKKGKWQKS